MASSPVPTGPVKHTAVCTHVEVTSDSGDAQEKVNEYVIVKTLGEGAFAVVKLAVRDGTSDHYAMKVFSKRALRKKKEFVRVGRAMKCTTALDKAERELAIMKKAAHPHVVRCHEIIDDADGDGLYMVLQFVQRGQVMEWEASKLRYETTSGAVLDEDTARSYARDMVLGLDYLHRHRIVHRDIKPENVLVSGEGRALLADLGVAHFYDEDQSDSLTKTDGTPPFFAPECVAGQLPFFDPSPIKLCSMIASNPVDFSLLPLETSAECREVVQRLLDKDPAARITMVELLKHPWLTHGGTRPLVQYDDSAPDGAIPVSEEEVKAAVTPLARMDLLVSLKLRMRRHVARRRLQRTAVSGAGVATAAASRRARRSIHHSFLQPVAAATTAFNRRRLSRVPAATAAAPPKPPAAAAKPPAGAGAGAGAGATKTKDAPKPPPLPPHRDAVRRGSKPPRVSFAATAMTSQHRGSAAVPRKSIAESAAESKDGFVHTVGEAGRQLLSSALRGGASLNPKPAPFDSSRSAANVLASVGTKLLSDVYRGPPQRSESSPALRS